MVTVKYINHIGQNVQEVIPYEYGDHVLLANHINCSSVAIRYGKNYIKGVLEPDRLKESGQQGLI